MENGSKSESAQTEVIAPVWRDWHTVGSDFRRFEGLSKLEQDAIMRGDTVASEVMINDDMLWGSVFRYEPSMKPEALAAIFHDYDGQYRFVPGMPETRVVNRTGKLHRVFHRINPITFFLMAKHHGRLGSTMLFVIPISWTKKCSARRRPRDRVMLFVGRFRLKRRFWEHVRMVRSCSPEWVRGL